MKFLQIIFLFALFIKQCHTWSGILMDDLLSHGGTQLYFPTTVPHTMGNATKFGLQHFLGSNAAYLNGKAYFIGGKREGNASALTFVFDPVTNSTIAGSSLNIGRQGHTAIVFGV